MPTRYTGRVVVILLVVLGSLWALFPDPTKVFNRDIPWSQKLNLKPGIDMVGGSSLLYEIKRPEGSHYSGSNLVEQVMGPLKRRVDPEGVKNLVWRPQGETRLEIQMPLLAGSEQAEEKRQALIAAQRKLEDTNVSPAEVIAVIEGVGAYKGQGAQDRQKKLDELAQGSPRRQKLFKELADAYDRLQAARQRQDVAATVDAQDAYRAAQAKIEETNLTSPQLEQDLALPEATRKAKLQQHLQDAEGFPARRQAVEEYAAAYDAFAKVRNLVDNVSDLKRKLQGAGVLEFHIAAVPPSMSRGGGSNIGQAEYDAAVEQLKKRGPRPLAGEPTRWFLVEREDEARGQTVEYGGKRYILGWVTPERSMDNREGRSNWKLIDVRSGPKSQLDPQQVVIFTFDPQGGKYFSDLTGANVNQPLMAILDGKVISVANINSRIGETGIIEGGGEGGFSPQQLDYLVSTMAAGSLPAQLTEEPISERSVGPQLGKDNLKTGLYSCYFGVGVVAVFLIGYYYRAGAVAFTAVLLNLLIILGSMALLNATFTLPAIAGIVLTIGMAVDSNVLIFERLREEQVRGLSLRMALRNAYDKAWTAILDSNVTTGITAAVLYYFGSEEVKGFGLTLLIGIVASLFTALFVTKTIFGLWLDRFGLEKLGSLPLTFPRWDRMLRPNIDWMGKAKYFAAFSAVVIVVGLVAFGVRLARGQMLDVEFTSGTSVQFELKPEKAMRQEEVRERINAYSARHEAELPSPYVVSVGTDGRTYEVVSPNANRQQVSDAVLAAMRDPNDPSQSLLKLEVPSTFEQVGATLDAAMTANVVVPIASADQDLGTPEKRVIAQHVGGVAIPLRNLNPPLKPDAVKDRLARQRLQSEQRASTGIQIDVVPTPQPNTVIVLASDRSFPYDANDPLKLQQWRDEVAQPVWQLTNEAVNKPAGLQRVINFDAQVAGETQRDATVAMVISVLAIVAYIWMRFGNLKYGSATVVALAHDVLFTIAAIGISHYLSELSFVRNVLLLEPFRINLTMIAAILTVMGWSMNDTVVVFDRIRENRGKYGMVNRQIINDSINQTLSRTLLTGSTTILTIFVMYVFGGPGIHGFTFALLVGILVGTYSSIAIASPFLLFGSRRAERATAKPVRSSSGRLQQAGA
jgi:SecD/SecF fusion protein